LIGDGFGPRKRSFLGGTVTGQQWTAIQQDYQSGVQIGDTVLIEGGLIPLWN